MPIGLNTATLWRAATIVWKWSYVVNDCNFDTGLVYCANSSFATRTRAFHKYFRRAYTCIKRCFCSIAGSNLGSIRCILFLTTESGFTSRSPGNHLTLLVCDRNDQVIETRMDEYNSIRRDFNLPFDGLFCSSFCHLFNLIM